MKDMWAMLTRAAMERIAELETRRQRMDPRAVAGELLGQYAIIDEELRLRLEGLIRDMTKPRHSHP